MDIGLLILRVLLACVLYAHATQKVFGWFSGPGLVGAAAIFDKLGQRPGRAMAILAAGCEASAALLLVLGAFTPLGAAVAAGTMFVAGASMASMSGTFWNAAGGGEYPFVLAAAAAVLAFTGAGAFSVDAVIDAPWYGAGEGSQLGIAVGAVVLAFVAAALPLIRMRRYSASGPAADVSADVGR
jgi:putative oxidoreductase